MPEMELFIKPVFAKESVDRFAGDVERQLGSGGGGVGGIGSAGEGLKEQKKQTGVLESINKFSKVMAAAGIVASAATMLPGAVNLGKSLGDTRQDRMERAFRGGDNYSDDIADRIQAGEELTEVLTKEQLVQEGLDQARRQATAELEGNTFAAEDAAKTLDDLRATYVDTGGTIEDFNDQVASLGAKAWIDGDITKDEVDKIDESIGGVKESIEDVAAGLDEFANNTETKMQETKDSVENDFGKALEKVGVGLEALPNVFNEVPLIKKLKGVAEVLKEINDFLTDIKKFNFSELLDGISSISPIAGAGINLGRAINNKIAGDSIR